MATQYMHPRVAEFLRSRDLARLRGDRGIERACSADLRRLGVPDSATLAFPEGTHSVAPDPLEEVVSAAVAAEAPIAPDVQVETTQDAADGFQARPILSDETATVETTVEDRSEFETAVEPAPRRGRPRKVCEHGETPSRCKACRAEKRAAGSAAESKSGESTSVAPQEPARDVPTLGGDVTPVEDV